MAMLQGTGGCGCGMGAGAAPATTSAIPQADVAASLTQATGYLATDVTSPIWAILLFLAGMWFLGKKGAAT
jgi:hypothetical protein